MHMHKHLIYVFIKCHYYVSNHMIKETKVDISIRIPSHRYEDDIRLRNNSAVLPLNEIGYN